MDMFLKFTANRGQDIKELAHNGIISTAKDD